MRKLALIVLCAWSTSAETSTVHDSRLSVHTLVREDLFAGILANDEARLSKGERTLEQLLVERPNAKASLVAWQGWAALTRAVLAHERNDSEACATHYQRAKDLFAIAAAGPASPYGGVEIITGGSYAMVADRLPEQFRADAWSRAYDGYRKVFAAKDDRLYAGPLHFKGEILAGLAQTAQRTGREDEYKQKLEFILEKLPGTPYAARAQRWKDRPELAARTSMLCQTCHEPGRLAVRTAALPKQQ
jgi:hypothetical protein